MNKFSTSQLLFFIFFLTPFLSVAQYTDHYLSKLKNYHEVDLDVRQLQRKTSQLSTQGTLTRNSSSKTEIELPMPDGDFARFRIWESSLMTPELAADRPYIKSYLGQGIDDPTAAVRFSITPSGMSAIIKGIDGITHIRGRETTLSNTDYIAYYDHDVIMDQPYECLSQDLFDPSEAPGASLPGLSANSCFALGDEIREYKVALSCTGEFYDLNGNNDASAEAALLARLEQVSVFYEQELSIKFVASALLLNRNPLTDPFDNPEVPSSSIGDAAEYIFNNIGTTEADLGHTFHEWNIFSASGIAGVGVVCREGVFVIQYSNDTINPNDTIDTRDIRFRGYTVIRNGDPTVSVVTLHEFGHMFSCRHTNYGCGSTGDCGRYEPGKGTSIMSTDISACSNEDRYDSRTDYFGIGSLQSIITYITSGTDNPEFNGCASFTYSDWSDCSDIIGTTNNIPVSDADADGIDGLTIPYGTPFELNGAGTDADGNGSLTFNWEQYDTDLNSADPFNTANISTAALFRTFPPSTSTSRTVPALSTILANSPNGTGGETLPTVARTLTWRLTVRDNNAGNGGISCDEISLNVAATGPFQITTQNSATAWTAGDTETIVWDVAGTNAATFTCPNVDILWSTDGGLTFPVTLASNVPNNGSQDITVPANATSSGRLKIVCTGSTNIFFDINNVDIAILDGCTVTAVDIVNNDPVVGPAGDASLDLDLIGGLAITMVESTLDNSNTTTTIARVFNGSCQHLNGNLPVFEQRSFMVDVAGTYTVSEIANFNFNVLTLYENSYAPSQGCTDWLTCSWIRTTTPNVNTVNSSISNALVTNQVYVLVDSGSNAGQFGDYTNTFSGPGNVFQINDIIPAGFQLYFVMVNSSGNIVAVGIDADLSNASLFPEDSYTINALVSPGGTDFSNYVDNGFASLEADVNDETICGAFGNTVPVTIQAALPVSLTKFSATLIEPNVQLDWQTVSELDNDFFTLERSSDGRNFTKLTKVKGQGTTTQINDYQFLDKNPLSGTSYYRLLQTDFDGTSEYVGEVVVINRDDKNSIRIQPNPIAADILALEVSGIAGKMEIYVYNTNGQLLRTSIQQTIDGVTAINLPVNELTQGVYLLKAVVGETIYTERFIKAK